MDSNITRARSGMKLVLIDHFLFGLFVGGLLTENCGICMYCMRQAVCKNSIVYSYNC